MTEPEHGPEISAERARQGEIVLRSRLSRLIFIAGLAGAVILGLVLVLARR